MNKIYRTVWNACRGMLVVAAENVASCGKRGTAAKALIASALAVLSASAAAQSTLPTGATVTAGQATVQQSGNQLNIHQSSDKASIDWQSFSVGQGQSVNFTQPSASSVALNRVLGSDVSVIQGAINANGQVFLVNPNGVLFSPTAQVNTGALVASTLNITNEDFLAGNYRFSGNAASAVSNSGSIQAKSFVALIAAKIENMGSIAAGESILAGAGQKVRLDFGGPVRLIVEQGAIDASIANGGGLKADNGNVFLTAKAVGYLASSVINHDGRIEANGLSQTANGQVILSSDRTFVSGTTKANEIEISSLQALVNTGSAVANKITVNAGNVIDAGTWDASSTTGVGGSVAIRATGTLEQTVAGTVKAQGTSGGTAALSGTSVHLSGTTSTAGTQGQGGTVAVTGGDIALVGGTLDASGAQGGGSVFFGGGWQGANASLQNAKTTYVAKSSAMNADAVVAGKGGTVVAWSDEKTSFAGSISAKGGPFSGNGGSVEVSSHGSLHYAGKIDVQGPSGKAGNVLLDPKNIIISDSVQPTGLMSTELTYANAQAGDLHGSAGAKVLPNGNILVLSPQDDRVASNAGAARLYRPDGTLVSTLTGRVANDQLGLDATVLSNGNYVVLSNSVADGGLARVGAATFANANVGVNGVVSLSNSLMGSKANDAIGTNGYALKNGNYVVVSTTWDNGAIVDAGAATWGNGTTGIVGQVSSANSLVGLRAYDRIGVSGVMPLTNGNYVVLSSTWDNGAIADAGAATWGNGSTGIAGGVSSANSLVGSTASDRIGVSALALPNGNYVVNSVLWDRPGGAANVGAVTWGNGTTGVKGAVSITNSLHGTTANDFVGNSITILANGNYVVGSNSWNRAGAAGAGAVTWAKSDGTTVGAVSTSNSLVGSTAGDNVGSGVVALSNGNYVVRSPAWKLSGTSVGAVTLGNGTTGTVGAVSTLNSLHGSQANDGVGSNVVALPNGNFVVGSSSWSNGATAAVGAVTLVNGISGLTGPVSGLNSLIGTYAQDRVGTQLYALPNSHYVVSSPSWGLTNVGALTHVNTGGLTGQITSANSLLGSTANDAVSDGGIVILTNGNYVVKSFNWNNGAATSAGAATFVNGNTGLVGTVSASNSLVGSQSEDRIGGSGITALPSGNYVVVSSNWSNGAVAHAGAVTLGNKDTGVSGVVSDRNSIIGGSADDYIGSGSPPVELTNGDVVFGSYSFTNGTGSEKGAFTLIEGNRGTYGQVNASNSWIGTDSSDSVGVGPMLALNDGRALIVGAYVAQGKGSARIIGRSAQSYGDAQGSDQYMSASQIASLLNTGASLTLQASNDLHVASAINVNNPNGNGGNLTLSAGRSVAIDADIHSDNGDVKIIANDRLANGVVDSDRESGAAKISMGAGVSITAGSGHVDIELRDGQGLTHRTTDGIVLGTIEGSTIKVVDSAKTPGAAIALNGQLFSTSNAANSIVLAGSTLTNNYGFDVLDTAGSWQIYLDGPNNAYNGLQSGNKAIWGQSYNPNVTLSAPGNRFVFGQNAAMTLTANNASRAFGDNVLLTYSVAGDAFNAALYGNAFVNADISDVMNTSTPGVTLTSANYLADVGNYTIAVNGTVNANAGFNFTTQNGTLTIDPRVVHLSGTQEYDGTTSVQSTALGLTNLVNGQTLTLSGAGEMADKNVGASKLFSTGTLQLNNGSGLAGNYTLVGGNKFINVNPKVIQNISGISAQNKTYDGNTIATADTSNATLAGVIGTDTVGLSHTSAQFDNKNVGIAKTVTLQGLSLNGSDASNYTLGVSTTSANANVAAATLTLTGLAGQNKTYDGTNVATIDSSQAQLGGKVSGDDVSVGLVTGSFLNKDAGVGKTVNVNGVALSGADATNYTLSPVSPLSASIAKADIVRIDNLVGVDKTYDGSTTTALDASQAQFVGMVFGDSLQVASGLASFVNKDAGIGKVVQFSGLILGGTDSHNYNLLDTTATGQGSIERRSVSVVATNLSKNVGDVDPALVYSIPAASPGGLVGGEQLVGALSRDPGETAGAYAINQGSLTDANNGNYSISFAPGQLSIVEPPVVQPPVVQPPVVQPPIVQPPVVQPPVVQPPVVQPPVVQPPVVQPPVVEPPVVQPPVVQPPVVQPPVVEPPVVEPPVVQPPVVEPPVVQPPVVTNPTPSLDSERISGFSQNTLSVMSIGAPPANVFKGADLVDSFLKSAKTDSETASTGKAGEQEEQGQKKHQRSTSSLIPHSIFGFDSFILVIDGGVRYSPQQSSESKQ